jgi:hypothetical protein
MAGFGLKQGYVIRKPHKTQPCGVVCRRCLKANWKSGINDLVLDHVSSSQVCRHEFVFTFNGSLPAGIGSGVPATSVLSAVERG